MTTSPPPAELVLQFMRDMLAAERMSDPVMMLGTGKGITLLVSDGEARESLALLELEITLGRVPSTDWVVLLSDTHTMTDRIEPGQEEPVIEHGQLGEMFQRGDPRISEAILAILVCPDGPEYVVQQTYVREGGRFAWGEVTHIPPSDIAGVLIEGLRRVVAAEPMGARR